MVPSLSEHLTWEGWAANVAVGMAAGGLLGGATPFSAPQAIGMSLIISLFGFAGVLCLHAVKADRGRKGVVVVEPRGGMMDRVFGLCFAAPVFFHVTRYYFSSAPAALF